MRVERRNVLCAGNDNHSSQTNNQQRRERGETIEVTDALAPRGLADLVHQQSGRYRLARRTIIVAVDAAIFSVLRIVHCLVVQEMLELGVIVHHRLLVRFVERTRLWLLGCRTHTHVGTRCRDMHSPAMREVCAPSISRSSPSILRFFMRRRAMRAPSSSSSDSLSSSPTPRSRRFARSLPSTASLCSFSIRASSSSRCSLHHNVSRAPPDRERKQQTPRQEGKDSLELLQHQVPLERVLTHGRVVHERLDELIPLLLVLFPLVIRARLPPRPAEPERVLLVRLDRLALDELGAPQLRLRLSRAEHVKRGALARALRRGRRRRRGAVPAKRTEAGVGWAKGRGRGAAFEPAEGGAQRRVARIGECERTQGKPAGGVQEADRRGRLRAEEVRVLGGRGAVDFRGGDVRARLGEESVWVSNADETS